MANEKEAPVKCKYLRVKTHMTRKTSYKCIMGHATGPPGDPPNKCFKKGGCKHGRYIEVKPK